MVATTPKTNSVRAAIRTEMVKKIRSTMVSCRQMTVQGLELYRIIGPIVLYGDNVQTSPQVVAIAKLDNLINTEEWTPFEINFNYYEEIDEQLLENYGYNFTIVCSSSERGAYFEGAIGSTLMVDKFRIICSKTEE